MVLSTGFGKVDPEILIGNPDRKSNLGSNLRSNLKDTTTRLSFARYYIWLILNDGYIISKQKYLTYLKTAFNPQLWENIFIQTNDPG